MEPRVPSHTRLVERVRPRSMRRFAVVCMGTLVGPLAFGGTADSAEDGAASAVRLCGERAALLEQFAMQHDETPQALGLGADGGVIEVLVSPEGGWTMLVTYPARPTCVIAMGEAWHMVQLAGEAS